MLLLLSASTTAVNGLGRRIDPGVKIDPGSGIDPGSRIDLGAKFDFGAKVVFVTAKQNTRTLESMGHNQSHTKCAGVRRIFSFAGDNTPYWHPCNAPVADADPFLCHLHEEKGRLCTDCAKMQATLDGNLQPCTHSHHRGFCADT